MSATVAQLQKQLQRQELVLEITRLLTSETDLDGLLPLVTEKTCLALGADRATMYLVDKARGEIWSKVTSALEIREIRLPFGVGLAGYVAQTGESVNIPDCYADPRFNPALDRQTGYLTRTMLVRPMRNSLHELIGVFQVLNKRREDGTLSPREATQWPVFTHEDAELLDNIAASAAIAVQNAQLLRETALFARRNAELMERTKEMFSSTIHVLTSTMDRRNPETAGHSHRVALSAVILARHMGCSEHEVEQIHYASLLHDFGKVGVLDSVLTKPGRLTEGEFAHMRHHALHTRQLLEQVSLLPGLEPVPVIAGQHHERLDGSGYPLGQRGEEITLGGRILAVADSYDALRMRRVYKPPFSIQTALEILRTDAAGGRLDSEVVETLVACADEIEVACGPLRPAGVVEDEIHASRADGHAPDWNGHAGYRAFVRRERSRRRHDPEVLRG